MPARGDVCANRGTLKKALVSLIKGRLLGFETDQNLELIITAFVVWSDHGTWNLLVNNNNNNNNY